MRVYLLRSAIVDAISPMPTNKTELHEANKADGSRVKRG